MALTQEEVNRMEEKADLQNRFNRAADRFVSGSNPRLRAAEREAELRDREADVLDRAHRRFMRSKRNFAARNPYAMSRQEYAATMGFERGKDPTGLREHELEMLKRQGENEFRVAEQKRFGMKEQGADAAGRNAEATKYGWDKQLEMEEKRQSGLTEREKIIGDRTERIAGMEHGTIDKDGKVTPGSRERVATISAEAAALQAELKRQHELEIANGKNQTQVDVAGTRIKSIQERRAQTDAMREQRDFEVFEKSVGGVLNNPLTQEQKKEYRTLKTPEERKAWWKSHFGREGGDQQPQDGKPKDGDRKQFKQGWGTWKDGKWVLDAQ